MIGAFMAILNIQITNASLLDIEGGIGTGVDNGSWISTSYLIGEIIVIPLTDYLSRVFSFRRYMLANARAVRGCSPWPARSPTTCRSMIAMRGLQGFAGGVLIPMAFTLVLHQAAEGAAADRAGDVRARRDLRAGDRPDHRRLSHRELRLADHLLRQRAAERDHGGGALLHPGAAADEARPAAAKATGSASPPWRSASPSLQTVLEEGNKDDWFGSPFIVRACDRRRGQPCRCSSAIELTVEKPLIHLRLLTQRNFGLGTLADVLVGFALFGSVYLLPAYLGQVQRYNAEQIGNVLAWTGLPQLLAHSAGADADEAVRHPLYRLCRHRLFAASCFMNITMSLDYSRRPVLHPEHRARRRPGARARRR